jgi:hypothetical protein
MSAPHPLRARMSLNSAPAIGFLTLGEHAELGLFGGYLVLNAAGRPLEFHCTAPVKANRAQEILYGNTLKPYLYGEQIGQTLVKKAKAATAIVFTDVEPALCARQFIEMPMAVVAAEESELIRPALMPFTLGRHDVAVSVNYASDRAAIIDRLTSHLDHLDLLEPFVRIREALEEAQKSARPAAA